MASYEVLVPGHIEAWTGNGLRLYRIRVGGTLPGCMEFVLISFRARQDRQGYGVVVYMLI